MGSLKDSVITLMSDQIKDIELPQKKLKLIVMMVRIMQWQHLCKPEQTALEKFVLTKLFRDCEKTEPVSAN